MQEARLELLELLELPVENIVQVQEEVEEDMVVWEEVVWEEVVWEEDIMGVEDIMEVDDMVMVEDITVVDIMEVEADIMEVVEVEVIGLTLCLLQIQHIHRVINRVMDKYF